MRIQEAELYKVRPVYVRQPTAGYGLSFKMTSATQQVKTLIWYMRDDLPQVLRLAVVRDAERFASNFWHPNQGVPRPYLRNIRLYSRIPERGYTTYFQIKHFLPGIKPEVSYLKDDLSVPETLKAIEELEENASRVWGFTDKDDFLAAEKEFQSLSE
jgi:hypothetical protein